MGTKRVIYLLSVVIVTLLALGVRLRAVAKLPIDYDEDDYLGAGQHYATALRDHNLGEIVNYAYNYEHPPLTKLVYGLAILPLPEAPQLPELSSSEPPAASLPQPHFEFARLTSATFGTLETLVLAILNPLAGLFLALNTWQIKYTSEIMLEPLPSLLSALAVLFYLRSKSKRVAWLALSAIALGLTAASKYTYCIAGIAILGHWLWVSRPEEGKRRLPELWRWLRPAVFWGTLAILVFYAADPHLWPDPFNRLKDSLLFHAGYAQSEHVKEAGFPDWQPLVWLTESVPWHPGVFIASLDLYITVLAAAGFRRTWERQRVFALWLVIALGFLLVWPTKWPQYILILTAPLSLAAANGFQAAVWEPLSDWLKRRGSGNPQKLPAAITTIERREARQALPWLAPGLLALAVITLFPMIYQLAMAMTDFNALSIRDGIRGGVLREVWDGLTFQEKALPVGIVPNPFGGVHLEVQDRGELRAISSSGRPYSSKDVHYIGPSMLLQILSGAGGDLLVFTILWTMLSVGLQTLLGLGLALMLNRGGVRFRNAWRALFILPWAIPEFIGGLMWFHVFEPTNGWLSLALHTKIDWYVDQRLALLVMLTAATWIGFPFMMVAVTAGLKLVPGEVYDASAVDGANNWEQFRFITWPLLMPLLVPALIIRAIFAFNQFYLFYVMQPPFINFATLSFYIFNTNNGGGGQFAISAAINLVTVLILVILILWFNRWQKVSEGVTYA